MNWPVVNVFIGWIGFIVLLIMTSALSVKAERELEVSRVKGEMSQMSYDRGPSLGENDTRSMARTFAVAMTWIHGIAVTACTLFLLRKNFMPSVKAAVIAMAVLSIGGAGCRRPFEPIKLEVVGPNEDAFLIPFIGSVQDQASTHSEDLLRQSLVQVKQVKIPQQWVPVGYETVFPNGIWKDAAVLIRVDRSPVTREWTADPATGTSSRNEAVWVMTSDQVEFSTGWVCTARISSTADAIKFLHNYPNGTIETVMDREVRAKIQTSFGLEVTDQSMKKLREEATPHIQKVVSEVSEFFAERGLAITNLGISGGFIYRDAKIQDKLVELFNAEQEKLIAIAKADAVKTEAKGKADAAKEQASGEAEAIKTVADAKAYEIEKSKQDLETYLALKKIEIEKAKLEKWDGKFPTSFLGGTGNLDMLLTVPGK